MNYQKTEQTKRNRPEKKKCSVCLVNRDVRFFSSKRARICGDCKRRKWSKALRNSPTKLKAKAWNAFSMFVRLRDSLKTTGTTDYCVCITCDKKVPFKSIQGGHFVGGRKGSVLFDEEIVNGQCQMCNVFLRGNYQVYTLKMIERWGIKKVEEMLAKKKQVKKYSSEDYKEIAEKYKQMIKEL